MNRAWIREQTWFRPLVSLLQALGLIVVAYGMLFTCAVAMGARNGLAYHLPPLHYYSGTGDLPRLQRWLDEGNDVEERDGRGARALEFALYYGQWNAAEELVRRGSDVSRIDRHPGWSDDPGGTILNDLRHSIETKLGSRGQRRRWQSAIRWLRRHGASETRRLRPVWPENYANLTQDRPVPPSYDAARYGLTP